MLKTARGSSPVSWVFTDLRHPSLSVWISAIEKGCAESCELFRAVGTGAISVEDCTETIGIFFFSAQEEGDQLSLGGGGRGGIIMLILHYEINYFGKMFICLTIHHKKTLQFVMFI